MRFLLRVVFSLIFIGCMICFAANSRVDKNSSKHVLLSIDHILIKKKERILELYQANKLIKSYQIALGFNPTGHKQQEGDGKTPEGVYSILYKNPKSKFHLSLKISYPNAKDKKNANKKGVNPGGDIMIHGLGKDLGCLSKKHVYNDWTLGCIAVTNEEITEIYDSVNIGTSVEILP